MMKKILSLLCYSITMCYAQAQTAEHQMAIKQTITHFFDAMRHVDSTLAKKTLHPEVTLKSVSVKKDGNVHIQKETAAELIKAIGMPRKDVWDERILSWDIHIDGALATAWCDYAFYLNNQFSHCGIDAFQLIKQDNQWLIWDITDTRRKTNCTPITTAEIDTVMNRWHHAAAVADEDTFFGIMTADADYIGTDPTEHWKRDELKKWSEKYFQRDSAWDFKPKQRTIYFTENGQYAWFDELLDTWMGDCRGSGILVKTDDGWRIKQYVLSMAVLNDLTKEYINLLKKNKK